MKLDEDTNTNYSIGTPNEEWKRKYGSEAVGNTDRLENPTGSKDVIWHDKRNYSEIVVEPQERSDKE